MAKKPNIITRVLNRFGFVKENSVNVFGTGILDVPAFAEKKTRDYLEAYKGWVYASVKARSQDVASIKLKLYKANRKSGEAEEVVNHDILSLLRSVNEWTTARGLIEATQVFKDLAGEAFWYLQKAGEGAKGKIIRIVMLRPDWVEIIPDEKTFIKEYRYRIPGASAVIIPKEQIIHHKTFNPLSDYRGLSVVAAAAVTVDGENFAEQYNRKFFQNSAVPSIVLKTEQKLDDNIVKRVRAQWQNEYGGIDKAHRVAILEGGLDIQPFAMSQKEMEFLEGQKYSRDKIFALFQVPKTVLGMTEDVTVSNAEATDYVFSKRVIKPLMQRFVDTLNEFMLPLYPGGEDLFFDFEDPTPENKTAKIEMHKALFAVGAMTPNEIRAEWGLDEVVGLDRFYVPISAMPISGDGSDEADEEDDTVKGTRNGKKKIAIPPQSIKNKIAEDIGKEVGDKLMKEIAGELGRKEEEAKLPEKSQFSEEQQTQFWKGFVTKSINYEKKLENTVKANFNRQEKETLARLEATQKGLNSNDIDKILFSVSTENKLSAEIILPLLKEFAEETGSDAFDLLGLTERVFDTTTATMRNFFTVRALKGIKKMNRVTKSELRQVLAQVVKDGKGIPEAARAIKGVFEGANTVRATRIARTEIIKAGNAATLEAYKQSGVVAGKQWFTALDERTCEFCAPLHGRVKALDNNFFHEGETWIGREGGKMQLDFDNIPEPPLHPNCRCTLIPILRG